MIGKIAVDLAMTVLLLLLMAKQLTGDVAHEWLGAGMFVFWIAHTPSILGGTAACFGESTCR